MSNLIRKRIAGDNFSFLRREFRDWPRFPDLFHCDSFNHSLLISVNYFQLFPSTPCTDIIEAVLLPRHCVPSNIHLVSLTDSRWSVKYGLLQKFFNINFIRVKKNRKKKKNLLFIKQSFKFVIVHLLHETDLCW